MPRSDRNTPEYRAKAAERMRRWRAENAQVHRDREKARYLKKRAEDPDKLREQKRVEMAAWRAKYPEKAKAAQRRWYAANPEKVRRTQLKYKYGIALEVFEQMLSGQNGKCAICGDPEPRGWCVDHCHTTGAVRGILCHPCNTAIGFMEDDPDRLIAAANYLASE